MPQLKVLPHPDFCPAGLTCTVPSGSPLCEVLLQHRVAIEHACERSCACATCHVIVRAGFDGLDEPDDEELDQLSSAWGVEPHSRLSCQVVLRQGDVTIEIPRHTRNLARERR